MNDTFTFSQNISLKQVKGMFTRKNKLKIAIEEYMQNEIDYEIQKFDEFKKTRVLIVESLLLRPNNSISSFWYEITEENIWIILSYPIIIKLDHSLMSLLIRFIISTLNKFTNENFQSLQEAELSSFKEYMDEMERVRSKKGSHLAEKLKQVLFLLVNQYYKSRIPIIPAKNYVPPSEKHLQSKIDTSFSKIRSIFPNLLYNLSF